MTDTSRYAVERLLDGVTPGPWRVGPVDDCRVEDADGNEVAQIDGDYNSPDLWPKMEANARFIAASRDLVPALLARAEAAEARLHEFQAAQGYRYIGRDMKPVLARDLEDRAEAAEKKLAAAYGALRLIAADEAANWQANHALAEVAESKLAIAVQALGEIATDEHPLGWIAITALAEIKGERHE